MRVAVLDHGMGNLRSVTKALEAAGADVVVTGEPSDIARADGLCVPGQGIFGRCMHSLKATGLGDVVRDWIRADRPYLGICLGMQILFESSEERGPQPGLGVLRGRVARLPSRVTVPHMGWNIVRGAGLAGPQNERGRWFYFDHSYAAYPSADASVRGWCEHGTRFAAWVVEGAMTAVQFHPEKSSSEGISLLREWLTL